MGLPWGCYGTARGFYVAPGGVVMDSWGYYVDLMGPRCGLYGNADMLAVFRRPPPSARGATGDSGCNLQGCPQHDRLLQNMGCIP